MLNNRVYTNSKKLRAIVVFLVLLSSVASFTACSGSGSDSDANLTEAENDVRVGRRTIRCAVQELDADAVAAVNEFFGSLSTMRQLGNPLVARSTASVNVPVVVHVLASGPEESQGNVSDVAIAEQMNVLNAAFGGTFGGAATAFQFSLVGVTRTIDPQFSVLEFGTATELTVKQALRQGDAGTLNIYIAESDSGTLGYATFPWDFPTAPVLDGVVVVYQTLPGGSFAPYNEGDTLVHEVGHWLGLFHSFQGACGSIGDDIADTGPEFSPAFGCPVGRDSCGGDNTSDPVNNYMDYSDDFCLLEFTPGQAERMDMFSAIFRGL